MQKKRRKTPKIFIEDWIEKQIFRQESQRTRLRLALDEPSKIETKLGIEKMIFEVEKEITSLQFKILNSIYDNRKQVNETINKYLKSKGYNHRVVHYSDLLDVPVKLAEEVTKARGLEDF